MHCLTNPFAVRRRLAPEQFFTQSCAMPDIMGSRGPAPEGKVHRVCHQHAAGRRRAVLQKVGHRDRLPHDREHEGKDVQQAHGGPDILLPVLGGDVQCVGDDKHVAVGHVQTGRKAAHDADAVEGQPGIRACQAPAGFWRTAGSGLPSFCTGQRIRRVTRRCNTPQTTRRCNELVFAHMILILHAVTLPLPAMAFRDCLPRLQGGGFCQNTRNGQISHGLQVLGLPNFWGVS